MPLTEFLERHSDELIVNKLNIVDITKLCCTCKSMYERLYDEYADLADNINIYRWSRNYTMYVTLWGDGVSLFLNTAYSPPCPTQFIERSMNGFVTKFTLDELQYKDEELYEALDEYPNFKRYANYREYIGKETKGPQLVPPPEIVCTRY